MKLIQDLAISWTNIMVLLKAIFSKMTKRSKHDIKSEKENTVAKLNGQKYQTF